MLYIYLYIYNDIAREREREEFGLVGVGFRSQPKPEVGGGTLAGFSFGQRFVSLGPSEA